MIEMAKVTFESVTLPNHEVISYQEREGGEEVVVLVHGNMTSSVHWDLVLENMDPKYKLYAIDLRGFGKSTYLEPVYAIKDFSEDLKQFVDQLQLKSFALVGWSMGGAVSLQFCSDYPSYCNKLLLLASASTRGYPFFATGQNGLPDASKRLKTLEEVKEDKGKTIAVQTAYDTENHEFLKTMWNMLIYRNKQPEGDRYQKYVEDMVTQRNLAEVYQALNLFNISGHHNGLVGGTNQAKDIQIPVLIMRGNEDLVVSEQMTTEILEDLGENAHYAELKGCGHSPLIDDLDQLLNTMEKFLDRKEHYTV